jgi:hypothetical protein
MPKSKVEIVEVQQLSNSPRIILIIGSILVVFGSFLAWIDYCSLASHLSCGSISGLEFISGIFTLFAGLAFFIVALARKGTQGKIYSIWIAVLALCLLLFMIIEWIYIGTVQTMSSLYNVTIFGPGFYLVILGSILCPIGGFLKS